jgi:phosphatidylglycerophosphate synthase
MPGPRSMLAFKGVAGTWILGLRWVGVLGGSSSSSSSLVAVALVAGFFEAGEIGLLKPSFLGDRTTIVDFLAILAASSASTVAFHSFSPSFDDSACQKREDVVPFSYCWNLSSVSGIILVHLYSSLSGIQYSRQFNHTILHHTIRA